MCVRCNKEFVTNARPNRLSHDVIGKYIKQIVMCFIYFKRNRMIHNFKRDNHNNKQKQISYLSKQVDDLVNFIVFIMETFSHDFSFSSQSIKSILIYFH
jgi:hypothetical protein